MRRVTIQAGQTLLHYRLIEKIGEGGMGVVWRAEDTKLHRPVALKFLSDAMAADPERRARFEREARAVAALNHPNIVTLYSVEEADTPAGSVHFITMELVAGSTLRGTIPSAGQPPNRLLDLAIPLADAVGSAHERGITHRDLKPDNVMVGSDGRIKVLDFGLAKQGQGVMSEHDTQLPTRTATHEGKIVGTLAYMSPEQIEGKTVDSRSDVFSLGIMLYEMATGRRPFSGETSPSMLSSILKDTPPPITDIRPARPRQLERIIRRCLAKDPVERFQSAVGLRSELVALRQELDSGAEQRPAGRRWWIPAALIGALAIVGAIFGRKLFEFPQPNPAGAPGTARTMIAVLPFENLGPAGEEFFAAGMTDEITSRLAIVRNLGVVSRRSAIQYADTDKTTKQVGAELGVDYLLHGTVRWAGDKGGDSRVRVSPKLIRVADDTNLWARTYDRVLEDVFEVQSEIAENVISQLGITLLEPERRAFEARPTENLEAYQAYLRGMGYLGRPDYSEENRRLAVGHLEEAVELDPDFVLAHAGLARAHAWLVHMKYDTSDARKAMARQAVERAHELAPDSPQVHLARGYYHYHGFKEYGLALEAFARAEQGLPGDAEIIMAKAYILRRQGEWQQSLDHLERASVLSPTDAQLFAQIGTNCEHLRKFEDAERYLRRSIALEPNQVYAYTILATTFQMWKGSTEESRAVLESIPAMEDWFSFGAWYDQELYEGRYDAVLERIAAYPDDPVRAVGNVRPKALLSAQVHTSNQEPELARADYAIAASYLEREMPSHPGEFGFPLSLGTAYAGLGRTEEAVRALQEAEALFPLSLDAYAGCHVLAHIAHGYALAGEYDAALDRVEHLLSVPSELTVPLLLLDPRWDPLRDHPRFQSLIGSQRSGE
jgi:TolB-like protein/Flp pilus assembly protein TadD